MTKEEFRDFYNKNKVLVWGIPIIIFLLIFDFLILKPKRRQKLQPVSNVATANVQTDTAVSNSTSAQNPFAPIQPLTMPAIPKLEAMVEERFKKADLIPFPATKNIFHKSVVVETVEDISTKPVEITEIKEQNLIDFKYHGYFVINNYQVALIRVDKELYTLQKKNFIPKTSYYLDEIYEDMVIILDKANKDRVLQVPLASISSKKVGNERKSNDLKSLRISSNSSKGE